MKLLDKVGGALLTTFVPGIDAKANCGKCSYSYTQCRNCVNHSQQVFHDDCGYLCATRCTSHLCV